LAQLRAAVVEAEGELAARRAASQEAQAERARALG
jgi:hypothetical protein